MPDQPSEQPNVAYNWHPAVHAEHFDEALYYILIRLHEPLHRPVAQQVRDLLDLADIKYACAYPLFGWADALLRVWLTPHSYERLVDILDDETKHNVEKYKGFAATQISYLWHAKGENMLRSSKEIQTGIAANTADIEKVASDPECIDCDEWRRLKDAELLFLRPPMPEGGVKFYTCLTRTSESLPQEHELEAIKLAMDSTPAGGSGVPMSERASLYCGEGPLTTYMVRCVADSFDDILALAESFDIHLKTTTLRPETLLVANPGAVYESDFVNDPLHLSHSDTNTARRLDFPPKVLATLRTQDRPQLNDLVVEACEMTKDDPSQRELVLEILRTSALDDRKGFPASLSFLLEFEPKFTEFLKRELGKRFGPDWLDRIREICEESEGWHDHAQGEMSVKLPEWTLGTWATTAAAMASLDNEFRGRLDTILGPGWDKELQSFKDLRNDLSHGRVHVLQRYDVYELPMTEFLRRAMKAAVFAKKTRK
ncbi:MAG TPA: hypothetical protein VNS60_08785 [Solirubrobacterales bacterium]|nr:hypothetical protein [Solirubrobacterales bacterium]